ncbi:hypothetical protein BDR26DRAFT_851874 [Obelidium mucronatum]|nr:hypothetical protein BDR26DRAFT_851874 [Obelidium mucronatum]
MGQGESRPQHSHPAQQKDTRNLRQQSSRQIARSNSHRVQKSSQALLLTSSSSEVPHQRSSKTRTSQRNNNTKQQYSHSVLDFPMESAEFSTKRETLESQTSESANQQKLQQRKKKASRKQIEAEEANEMNSSIARFDKTKFVQANKEANKDQTTTVHQASEFFEDQMAAKSSSQQPIPDRELSFQFLDDADVSLMNEIVLSV